MTATHTPITSVTENLGQNDALRDPEFRSAIFLDALETIDDTPASDLATISAYLVHWLDADRTVGESGHLRTRGVTVPSSEVTTAAKKRIERATDYGRTLNEKNGRIYTAVRSLLDAVAVPN